MDHEDHLRPRNLIRYTFAFSLARMFVAAVALFLGGYPPALWILSQLNITFLYGFVSTLLTLAWILSGASVLYLGYQWYSRGRILFGRKCRKDRIAFFIMLVTGCNLGLAGLFGTNIGMQFTSNTFVFIATGMLYLLVATYLFRRWRTSNQTILPLESGPTEKPEPTPPMRADAA